MTTRTSRLVLAILFVALLLAAGLTAPVRAAPGEGLYVPGLALSAVAGTGADPGVGACLTYPVLRLENANLYADVGLLADGQADAWGLFAGVSTDRPLPIIRQLPGDACIGIGYSAQSDGLFVYLRYTVF